MSEPLVIEAFAGPGGWSEGLKLARFTGRVLGVELDWSACKTAMANGHQRVQADVATFPIEHLAGRVDGAILSPPCTTFSNAGHGAGNRLTALLITAITRTARGHKVLAATRRACAAVLREVALTDPKMRKWTRAQRSAWARKQATVSVLVVQPIRWAYILRPRWIALEQVPSVLPLWTHTALMLRELGYKTWAGVLSAEEYGVPQTRKRAVLVARNDGLPVGPPEPTHQPYKAGQQVETQPDLFGDPLPPPVSMADALGWNENATVEFQRGKGMAERHGERPHRPAPAPAPTIRAGSGGVGTNLLVHEPADWVLAHGPEARATERGLNEPAATVFSQRSGNLSWKLRNGNQKNACERRACEPAGTLFFGGRTNAVDWVHERPATTVCGDARIAAPGHRDRAGGERQFTTETRRVTVQEAAILQSFPPDYEWFGTKSKQYEQCGNAVPPLLGAAVLRQFFPAAAGRTESVA